MNSYKISQPDKDPFGFDKMQKIISDISIDYKPTRYDRWCFFWSNVIYNSFYIVFRFARFVWHEIEMAWNDARIESEEND